LHNDKKTYFRSFRASKRELRLELFLKRVTDVSDKFHATNRNQYFMKKKFTYILPESFDTLRFIFAALGVGTCKAHINIKILQLQFIL